MPELTLVARRAIGDNVVLTAAIREIRRMRPDLGLRVCTPYPDLWLHNPHILAHVNEPLSAGPVHTVDYRRAINASNQSPVHFSRGFLNDICTQLHLNPVMHDLRPDLHLSIEEKARPPFDLHTGSYWVMFAGVKADIAVKMWDPAYWQRVVDLLAGHVQFVTVGRSDRVAIPATVHRTINYMDQTTDRQLLHLIYHSAGVVCGVTCGMHIAAAFNKPCVVLAGGREPWWWEAYNIRSWMMSCDTPPPKDFQEHVFVHSIGELDCCRIGGCGRTTVVGPSQQCCKRIQIGPSRRLPQCMQAIQPDDVAAYIRGYHGITRRLIKAARPPSLRNMELPVTICVLLHGSGETAFPSKLERRSLTYLQLHQRVINSVLTHTAGHMFSLRIGCNAVGPATDSWLQAMQKEHTQIQIFREPVNIGKEPMMRRLLANDPRDTPTLLGISPQRLQQILREEQIETQKHREHVGTAANAWKSSAIDLNTQWMVWLDDDTKITRRWLPELDRALNTFAADCFGILRYWKLTAPQERWVRQATWYRGVPFTYRGQGPIVRFCQGGCWGIRSKVLRTLNWPDHRLWHNNDDVMLGEALRQNGYQILDLNRTSLQDAFLIEDIGRRGMSQAPVGLLASECARSPLPVTVV